MRKLYLIICFFLTLNSCKINNEYFLAKERASQAEKYFKTKESSEYKKDFLDKYSYFLSCLILDTNNSNKTKYIKCGDYYIEKVSFSNPICFSFGKMKLGRKTGLWEHYCEGDILSMVYYKVFRSKVLFKRITPNYAW